MSDAIQASLRDIQRHDPDGGEREPTPEACLAFEAWSIERYGTAIWLRYCETNWDTREEI